MTSPMKRLLLELSWSFEALLRSGTQKFFKSTAGEARSDSKYISSQR